MSEGDKQIVTKFYNKKMIVSGHVYEIYEYERSVQVGVSKNDNGRSIIQVDEEVKRETRKKTLSTAKQTLRRLINCNIDAWGETPKFLTLTFSDNVTNVKQANYEFKKFRQRLEYQLKIKLKYAVVVEFQKRGAVHYHAIFFNLPIVQATSLAEIWSNGFIKINNIEQVDNIGSYVTKYMTKEEQEKEKEDKLQGLKSYFTSRGLNKPYESVEKEEIEQVATALSHKKVYESQFDNDYLGTINYTQINLKR